MLRNTHTVKNNPLVFAEPLISVTLSEGFRTFSKSFSET